MARVFGYSRPTASLPDPDSHACQLAEAGAEIVLVEENGAKARRAMRQRRRMIDEIVEDDTLILLSLDRLGTSFDDVVRCFELLINRGVNLRIVSPDFETSTLHLDAYKELLAILAGARSALHSDAVKFNVAAARAEGGKAGGTLSMLTPEQWPDIKERIRTTPLETVARDLGVSRQTLWTYRRRMAAQEHAVNFTAAGARKL